MTAIHPVSNDAEPIIEEEIPYVVEVTIEGVAAFLYHRWSCEAVAEKAAAKKGSKAKKTDDVESYVYRCEDGTLGIPGENLRMAVVTAAKFRQDPRSPRKSAMDLYKAGLVSNTLIAPTGKKTWDFLDQRRVTVAQSGITRVRPALLPGWTGTFLFQVHTPDHIRPADVHEMLVNAGRLVGIGDFRPTYGRFRVTSFRELLG